MKSFESIYFSTYVALKNDKQTNLQRLERVEALRYFHDLCPNAAERNVDNVSRFFSNNFWYIFEDIVVVVGVDVVGWRKGCLSNYKHNIRDFLLLQC